MLSLSVREGRLSTRGTDRMRKARLVQPAFRKLLNWNF